MTKKTKIYFDSAATSFPRPESVLEAITEYLKTCGNPGRGAHSYAMQGAREVMEARQVVAKFLGISKEERLVFTPGCTASLNFVIKGFLFGAASGGIVVSSGLEHNAVTRPLEQVKKALGFEHISLTPESDNQSYLNQLEEVLEAGNVRLCVMTSASNVTGQLLPFEKAASLCKSYGVPTLIDGAQTAGKLDLSLSDTDISFFCASGHKGLLGPPGVGILYVHPDFYLDPLITGGTGSTSESFLAPEYYPDRLEAGTLAGHDISGLRAGVEWILKQGQHKLIGQELELCRLFIDWASKIAAIRVYGPPDCMTEGEALRMPLVAFSVANYAPGEIAHILDTRYGIAVRPGLHCAAQAHRSFGTIETGLVRVSFGPRNNREELNSLFEALEGILKTTKTGNL